VAQATWDDGADQQDIALQRDQVRQAELSAKQLDT